MQQTTQKSMSYLPQSKQNLIIAPRVLLVCIKYPSRHPCPWCLIQKLQIPDTDTRVDKHCHSHLGKDDDWLRQSIAKACEWIFVKGIGVVGTWICETLGKKSLLPIQVRVVRSSVLKATTDGLTSYAECLFSLTICARVQCLPDVRCRCST
jgi:hypothetical protein